MNDLTTIELNSVREIRTSPFGPWSCAAHAAGSVRIPSELHDRPGHFFPASVPGTVASALRDCGQWSFEQPTELETRDWWYRTTFSISESFASQKHTLCFDGLATLAEVWLNDRLILVSDNMFRSYRVDISEDIQSENELVICFRSIPEALKQKRARPRWKTNLVAQQQLRWIRSSLQGRIPGWSPPAPPVGPWREIRLESETFSLENLHILPLAGDTEGIVHLSASLITDRNDFTGLFRVGSVSAAVELESTDVGYVLKSKLQIPDAELWWPHTHGTPHLYRCELVLNIDGEERLFPCSPVGFRRIEADSGSGFGLKINGESVFCRGACWTVSDILTLSANENQLRRDLTLAREAGMNMLRVCGTMVYESSDFYRLCDELGIMVWQDFMFANMDYPVHEPAFHHNISVETEQQLRRFASHPSIVVYCGSSETEQQAAMLGMPREIWSNDWFTTDLPALCGQFHPGTVYLPSTPTGGVLPFHTETGVTHYYGVGAYLRPTTDLRIADVKFTPECLGFSNIPEPEIVDEIMHGARAVSHAPQWKVRVPRDTGAGWDFEDVRDHYLGEIYQIDPHQLRSRDPRRYMQLSGTVPGEMMSRAFAEWRSSHTHNRGALVWFYKDLWPAAGWGIIDSQGHPKSTYYYLKRSWNPCQLTLTDEGLNGLHLHLTNEKPVPVEGSVEVILLKEPGTFVARNKCEIQIPPRSQKMLTADEILGAFYDVGYAYRFGPAHHDVVIVNWHDRQDQLISQAFHFIGNRNVTATPPADLQTTAEQLSNDEVAVTIRSERFLHAVRLTAKGYLPADNYFHLAPQQTKRVVFRSAGLHSSFRGEIEALNLESTPLASVKSCT